MAEAPPQTASSCRSATRNIAVRFAVIAGVAIALNPGRAFAQATATPRVEAVYPHDTTAFTEGLELFEGKLYESTGLMGKSTVRRVTLTTGAIEKSISLDSSLFGEGLTRIDRTLYHLTYTTGVGIVFDLDTFAELRRFTYTGQGWGLCYDGADLVMSNGSDKLAFRDPGTFAVRREVTVKRNGTSIDMLNELECVGSLVYINEWKTDNILRVDKATGNVLTVIDASALLTADEKRNANVLNGIAYDEAKRRFYLTGKYWPKLFEVSFDFDPGGSADAGVDAGHDAGADAGTVDAKGASDSGSDMDAPPDVWMPGDANDGQGGAGGNAGAGGGAGIGGIADPDGPPTRAGCSCRQGAPPLRNGWLGAMVSVGVAFLRRSRIRRGSLA